MQFKKFQGLRSIPALPPQNSLVSDRKEYSSLSSLGCPSAEDVFNTEGQSYPTLLSSVDAWFCIFTWVVWTKQCLYHLLQINKSKLFFSLLSQETFVNVAGHRNAACVSSVPYQGVLATKLLRRLPCHWPSCIPGCGGLAQQDRWRGAGLLLHTLFHVNIFTLWKRHFLHKA